MIFEVSGIPLLPRMLVYFVIKERMISKEFREECLSEKSHLSALGRQDR